MTVEIAPDTDDLNEFEKLMFGRPQVEEEVEEEQVKDDSQEDVPEEVEEEVIEEEVNDEDEPAPEEKPKKSRFQERIDELTTARREAERREEDLRKRLEELEKLKPVEKPVPEVKEKGEPTPDDVDENGEPLYPLGEFDKNYIRDLARHTFQTEAEAARLAQTKAQEEEVAQKAQEALREQWSEKLSEAVETKYPDMLEKTQGLTDVFSDLEEGYGEYLAAQIMAMDFGVDVLYHLGSNPEEAKNIVNSGPQKALIALGRLEARFALHTEESKEKKLRVSNAPTPPDRLNKGTSVASDIPDDTDDLAAFERKFYKRK